MQIAVAKQEPREDKVRTGMVNFFDKTKGFGFINDLETNERIFFHINNLMEPVNEADKVTFRTEENPRGLSAVEVAKLT
jgi:cold shock CspA family protein